MASTYFGHHHFQNRSHVLFLFVFLFLHQLKNACPACSKTEEGLATHHSRGVEILSQSEIQQVRKDVSSRMKTIFMSYFHKVHYKCTHWHSHVRTFANFMCRYTETISMKLGTVRLLWEFSSQYVYKSIVTATFHEINFKLNPNF